LPQLATTLGTVSGALRPPVNTVADCGVPAWLPINAPIYRTWCARSCRAV